MFRSLTLGVASLLLGHLSAQAATDREDRAQAANAPVVRPVSAVVTDGAPVCTHARRRLWLEGEGWVVRKISTCH